eukprot:7883518-Alexandrium_andersonii.AAC.1
MLGMTRGAQVKPRWGNCPLWRKLSRGGKGNGSLSLTVRTRHRISVLPLRPVLDPVLRFERVWSIGSRDWPLSLRRLTL